MPILTDTPYADAGASPVKSSVKPQPVLLLGHNRVFVAAKTYHLLNGRVTQRAFHFPDSYDIVRTACPRSFEEMVAMLRGLMLTPSVHFTFGRVRAAANLNAVRRKQVGGDNGGDIEDAPVSVLPVDTEAILIEAGVDPKEDPQGAAELAYSILTDAVPELSGAPCAVTFSNSAGFGRFDVEGGKPKIINTIRAHLWFYLDEPAYPSQIKSRFERANAKARELHGERLNNDLIDTSIYAPAKLVFTADPVLGQGVRDPIPSGERLQVIKGDADWVALDLAYVDAAGDGERRSSSQPFTPNPELLRDEDAATAALLRIASKMANPDTEWWGYARVMGLLRNFGHVYNIRQSVIREAVHLWASKSGKYDTQSTDNLLNSYGRNQMNRVSLGELLALERWSETDDAIYATMLADFAQRTEAKYKAKLKPLAEGQGITRQNVWSEAQMERRSHRMYDAIFKAYDYSRRFETEFNKGYAERVEKFNSGAMREEFNARVSKVAKANPGMSHDDVRKRASAQMMASERRKAMKAAYAAMEGTGLGAKGSLSIRLRKSIRRLLRWSAGVGKTTLFARHYVTDKRMRTQDYVNAYFHDTAAAERFVSEVLEQARLAGVPGSSLNVRLIVGRSNTKRTGNPTAPCLKPKAAEAVGQRGLNVYNSICRQLMAEDRDGNPIYDHCEHHALGSSPQKCDFSGFFEDRRPGLRVFVHQNMPTTQPDEWKLPAPNLVLVDENFISAMHEVTEMPIAWLWDEASYIDSDDDVIAELVEKQRLKQGGEPVASNEYKRRRAIIEAVGGLRVALEGQVEPGLLKLDRLVADCLGGKIEVLVKAAKAMAKKKRVTLHPSMSQSEVLMAVSEDRGIDHRKVVKVLERLQSDLINLAGIGRSNSLWVMGDGAIRLESYKTMRLRPNTSVLVIDADGNIDFARRVFGESVMENVLRGERLGTVVQNFEGEQSKGYMTRLLCVEVSEWHAKKLGITLEEAFAMPEVKAEIERRRKRSGRADAFYDELRDTVRKQVALGMRVLIAVPKAVRTAMVTYAKLHGGDTENDLLAHIAFQERVSENWFGARLTHPPVFVGSNEFKNFHVVHIVSREQPPIENLKGVAGAFFHDDPTVDLESDTVMALQPYALRNLNDVQVEVRVHPDERVQYLMSLSRELKMLQAIDRLRLLRQNPERLLNGEMFTPRVYVHSNLPLDGLEVDQLVGGHEMRTYGGSPWAAALSRPEGIMPVGVIPLTTSWVHKHAGLKNAEGGPMPRTTVKALVGKMQDEPHRAPDGAVVVRLEAWSTMGDVEPISALVSREVFLSRPSGIPALVSVALAHEDVFTGDLPHIDWRQSTRDLVEFGDVQYVEVADDITGEVTVEHRCVGGLGYLGASFGYGPLSAVGAGALNVTPTVTPDPKVSQPDWSAQSNSSPSFYRQTSPAATGVTLSGTVVSDAPKPVRKVADVVDAMLASGVLVPRGVKGYADIVALVTGRSAGGIRKALSENTSLRERWDAAITLADCTNMVTMPDGRYAVPARVTDTGSADNGTELLISLECLIEPMSEPGAET